MSDFYSNDEHARRIDERQARCDLRQRIRCVRCHRKIPEGKRADAMYCSDWCRRRHRFERLDLIRREIYVAMRMLRVVERCECGEPLDTSVRPGPVPIRCKRCYTREAMRRWRQKQREVTP